jgi:hypothetical protein
MHFLFSAGIVSIIFGGHKPFLGTPRATKRPDPLRGPSRVQQTIFCPYLTLFKKMFSILEVIRSTCLHMLTVVDTFYAEGGNYH